MRLVVLILFLATSAFAEIYPPIEVQGELNGIQIFKCYIKETITAENAKYRSRRKDDLCKNFPHDLEKIAGVELVVHMVGLNDIAEFQNFAAKYEKNIKKLEWINWGKYNATLQNFLDVFNSVPNIESIDMENWVNEFSAAGDEIFKLNHLKSLKLKEIHNNVLDMFVNHLPENSINELYLKVSPNSFSLESFGKLISKQQKIESLEIIGFAPLTNSLKTLTLKSVTFEFDYDKNLEAQKTLLKNFVAVHPQLVELNLIGTATYDKYIDDEDFAEICKLQSLSSLDFNFDKISTTAFRGLGNLKNLKHIFIKSGDYKVSPNFNELSQLNLASLESLKIYVPGFSLPDKFYEQIAHNFPNLKSLEMQLGPTQKINFFMKTFPELENLTVRFGQSNVKIYFNDSFDIEDFTHQKMKKLDFTFTHEKTPEDSEKFLAMLKKFPNVESLKIQGRFPFCEEFLTNLKSSLGKIKKLSMKSFEIPCNEDFAIGKINALKSFNNELDSVFFTLSNTINHYGGAETCVFYENGEYVTKPVKRGEFSLDPMIKDIKDDFVVFHDGLSNIRTVSSLNLEGGKTKIHKF